MKNSLHSFGNFVNQQKANRNHILTRLGLTEETIDLNMEIEKVSPFLDSIKRAHSH